MASSDSVFLIELAVEKLNSFIQAGNFRIRAKFGDVFFLKLKDPNEVYAQALLSRKKNKRASVRSGKPVVLAGQNVMIASDIDTLVEKMIRFPIEITVFSRDDPYALGIVQIPWAPAQIKYVEDLKIDKNVSPTIMRDNYKLFDEYTSKRVAAITLKVQLSLMNVNNNPITPQYSIESPLTEHTDVNLNPEFTRALTRKHFEVDSEFNDKGTIKTIYSGGRRKKKSGFSKKNAKKMFEEINERTEPNTIEQLEVKTKEMMQEEIKAASDKNQDSHQSLVKDFNNDNSALNLERNTNTKVSIASLVRSQTHLETTSNKCLVGVTKHWSTTSIEIKERLDTLNYIFGNLDGPFGHQVYCVGYFTVENDRSFDADPPKNDKSLASPNTGSPNSGTPGTGTPGPGKSTPNKGSGPSSPVSPGTATPKEGKGSPKPGVQSPPAKEYPKVMLPPPKPGPAVAGKIKPKTQSQPKPTKSDGVLHGSGKYSFKVCGEQCKMADNNACFENICSLDLPEAAAKLITMRKCTEVVECVHKRKSSTDASSDEHIVLDFTDRRPQDCCVTQQVVGGVSAKLTPGVDPCLCTCECTFGFVTKTTYCNICGGYEVAGDEMVGNRGGDPFPCPIYHKLTEKGKKGVMPSSSGGDARKKTNLPVLPADGDTAAVGPSARAKSKSVSPGEKRSLTLDKKSNESDKDTSKKGKKKKKDDRFKFNYGYKAPQIGHSQCVMPCSGHLHPVPKHMGWLWNSRDIPGLKPRPHYRPGAANKHVVRLLKIARYPEIVISKRRKKDTGKKKRPLKRPLLTVQKKDGEYNITMETMRTFTRPRTINMYPYEDKPVLTYTIGRTDEENRERQKRKERQQRRLEREQRAFIQNAFQDMCKEICMKTYQQALGILPFAEDLGCPCYPIEPTGDRVDLSASCSCTESTRSSGSTTDDDEWIVEFTPPNAYFDPAYVPKKVAKAENSTQYSYLDYKVKLLDRYGNPVPRFFIGPDGKKQCSDLGGFWGPNNKWLEINVDGYIGPDERWAPNTFKGPCGEVVDAEGGKFQATNGVWLMVGVDGYVNSQGEWCFYPKPKIASKDPKKHRNVEAWKKAGGCKGTGDGGHKHRNYDYNAKKSEATWSCFGDASPRTLSQMGIIGHGHDRRLLLSTLERMMAEGEDVKIPQTPRVPKSPRKKGKKHTDESTESRLHSSPQQRRSFSHQYHSQYYVDRAKCKHPQPSEKGIIVDERGHKTYFSMRNYKNTRPKERLHALGEKGVSLSSFHLPCLRSFISTEATRQQNFEHILHHNARVVQSTAQQT